MLKYLFALVLPPIALIAGKMETDYALFLFDNGEANMVASMLEEAEAEGKITADFRIVFMGAALDAMSREPFSHYPDKLISYRELGIEETIDRHWIREKTISAKSLEQLHELLQVQKKVWTGVSCAVFGQILEKYADVETVALRDNPNAHGDTDYFAVAEAVQNKAHKILVPSQAAAEALEDKDVVVIGHAPLEEWQKVAEKIDRDAVIKRLGLQADLPILVYSGSYGDFYENCFIAFLNLLDNPAFQVVIVPHPRTLGVVEKRLCKKGLIAAEFEKDPAHHLKTVEALVIADAVVVADATSTVVAQANALKKKVLYVNPARSGVSDELCQKNVIQRISNENELNAALNTDNAGQDIYTLLGIPRNGARLLWEELTR